MHLETQCDGSDLCGEIDGAQGSAFAQTYEGDPPSRVICDMGNIRVIADLSPLCVGHLLVLPQEHYLSFAQLMADGDAPIFPLLHAIVPRYLETFGALTILEHGSSSEMTKTACISHAHWHLLPVAGSAVNDLIAADGLHAMALEGLADMASVGEKAYFFCMDERAPRLYGADRPMRGQYLRSVVGRVLGIPDPLWDYSVTVRREFLRETMELTSDWSTPAVFHVDDEIRLRAARWINSENRA